MVDDPLKDTTAMIDWGIETGPEMDWEIGPTDARIERWTKALAEANQTGSVLPLTRLADEESVMRAVDNLRDRLDAAEHRHSAMAARLKPGQKYASQVAIERMAANLCPECGYPVGSHDGHGGPRGCGLTDNGVAQRLHTFRQQMLSVAQDEIDKIR